MEVLKQPGIPEFGCLTLLPTPTDMSLAQKWHPDHYDGEEKKKAEKMFIDIAAAKEVLTDDVY
ncbi:hypothetical protein E2C01_072977 [Portunus trituberculatus]|uniref:J domain-containing protein n=1 Tax=Portunus trituberculatus TaxID=210409 RepID=A0A5B7I1J6_PORTR|nr:hypothetical protein [Portunus trituberculatus]